MTREEALEQLKIEYMGEWDADIQAKFISIEALRNAARAAAWDAAMNAARDAARVAARDAAMEHEIEILRELLEGDNQ